MFASGWTITLLRLLESCTMTYSGMASSLLRWATPMSSTVQAPVTLPVVEMFENSNSRSWLAACEVTAMPIMTGSVMATVCVVPCWIQVTPPSRE